MAAIEHQHRGAGALVFALVDLQILVIEIERGLQAVAADRGEQRGIDVQIQRVAKLIAAAGALGFDAGGKLAGIMPAKTGFSERTQQVAQGFEPEKIERLVGDLELGFALLLTRRKASPPAP